MIWQGLCVLAHAWWRFLTQYSFSSSVECAKDAEILAVLLTGIGHDGANGLSELQKIGAKCIAESEKSAIVYGMPKRAIEINPNIVSLPLDDIVQTIKKFGES